MAKREWFRRFGSRLPCERLSFQRESMHNTHAQGPFPLLRLQHDRLTLDGRRAGIDPGAHRVRAEHVLAQEVCSIPRHPLSSHTRSVPSHQLRITSSRARERHPPSSTHRYTRGPRNAATGAGGRCGWGWGCSRRRHPPWPCWVTLWWAACPSSRVPWVWRCAWCCPEAPSSTPRACTSCRRHCLSPTREERTRTASHANRYALLHPSLDLHGVYMAVDALLLCRLLSATRHGPFFWWQVAAIAIGAVLPLFFSLGHSHSHGGGDHDHDHMHHHAHGQMETEHMDDLRAAVSTMVGEAAPTVNHHHHREHAAMHSHHE